MLKNNCVPVDNRIGVLYDGENTYYSYLYNYPFKKSLQQGYDFKLTKSDQYLLDLELEEILNGIA